MTQVTQHPMATVAGLNSGSMGIPDPGVDKMREESGQDPNILGKKQFSFVLSLKRMLLLRFIKNKKSHWFKIAIDFYHLKECPCNPGFQGGFI